MKRNRFISVASLLLVISFAFLCFAGQAFSQGEAAPCKNALTPLALLNVYKDTQATHPKAVVFDEPWNGYQYWLTFTPYRYADDRTENPHILASNNLTNWEEPTGYKNPLDPEPAQYKAGICYNSDSHLVYNDDLDRLECWWRFVNDAEDHVTIFRRWTVDGVNWSEKEIIQENQRSIDDYVSLSVIYEDGLYKIWTIGHGYRFRYWESLDGTNWQHQWEQYVHYPDSNLRSWHVDVIHTINGYEAVIVAFDVSVEHGSHQMMSLYYLHSDNNYDYSDAVLLLKPTTGTDNWDNLGIYRSALMYHHGKYYLFYSGIRTTEDRNVGLISGPNIFIMK